jgi:hypothetical protein
VPARNIDAEIDPPVVLDQGSANVVGALPATALAVLGEIVPKPGIRKGA